MGSDVPPIGSEVPPVEGTVKAPPVHDRGLSPLKTQQTDAKKRKPQNSNDKPNVPKKPKTSKARPAHVRQVQHHEENDVRYQVPQDWDEVKAIQGVLESVV